MHELSLVRSVLVRVLEVSNQYGGLPVERVHLEIGAHRNVVPELLDFAFRAARQGTCADHATLVWHTVPVEVLCTNCEAKYRPEDEQIWRCPVCGALGGRLVHGDELVLRTIELADTQGEDDASPRR